jgi:hypothetical protein
VPRSRHIRRPLRRRWAEVTNGPQREEHGVLRVIRRSRARRRRPKRRPERACRTARAVSHSHYDNGSESIDVGSEGFRSSSVPGGEDQRRDFSRRPAQGEGDMLQGYIGRRAALSARERPGAHSRCDPLARRTLTRPRGAGGRHPSCGGLEGRSVSSVLEGILPAQRVQLLLALDAIGSPASAHNAAVAAFLARPSRAVVD